MNPVTAVEQQSDGVQFRMQTGVLKLQVSRDSMIRVLYSATSTFPKLPDYVVEKTAWPAANWSTSRADDAVTVTTMRLRVKITRADGAIQYQDGDGNQLFLEALRKRMPVKVNGEDTCRAESPVNMYGSREGLYGLGQHQAGVWNDRGESVDISHVCADNVGDQFMYGAAFLVNPVTEPSAITRELYSPDGKWYDFWEGTVVERGRVAEAKAPLDRLPLYLRAGSILPMGPVMEWSTEHPEDPIELRVCHGADGDFTLYEDENDNYNYEKGMRSTIPLDWDDGQQRLTIGERQVSSQACARTASFESCWLARTMAPVWRSRHVPTRLSSVPVAASR